MTHASIHTGIKRIECKCCGARFSCHSNLIKHRRARADSCGLPQFDPDKTMRKRSSIEPRIPPTLMKSEIKVGKSTKVLRPGHAPLKPPAKGRGRKVKVEKQGSESEYSDADDNFDDDVAFVDDEEPDDPADNEDGYDGLAAFSVEVVPSTSAASATVPTEAVKKPKPRKSRKVETTENDMGVFNDLPDVHYDREDSEESEEEMMNNSNPLNDRTCPLNVKKEKEDFDFNIFNEKDDILNNLISESSENDVATIKLEPIYKVEMPENHQALAPMVDPLVSFLFR